VSGRKTGTGIIKGKGTGDPSKGESGGGFNAMKKGAETGGGDAFSDAETPPSGKKLSRREPESKKGGKLGREKRHAPLSKTLGGGDRWEKSAKHLLLITGVTLEGKKTLRGGGGLPIHGKKEHPLSSGGSKKVPGAKGERKVKNLSEWKSWKGKLFLPEKPCPKKEKKGDASLEKEKHPLGMKRRPKEVNALQRTVRRGKR